MCLRKVKYPERVLGACWNLVEVAARLELPQGGAGLSCITTRVA